MSGYAKELFFNSVTNSVIDQFTTYINKEVEVNCAMKDLGWGQILLNSEIFNSCIDTLNTHSTSLEVSRSLGLPGETFSLLAKKSHIYHISNISNIYLHFILFVLRVNSRLRSYRLHLASMLIISTITPRPAETGANVQVPGDLWGARADPQQSYHIHYYL